MEISDRYGCRSNFGLEFRFGIVCIFFPKYRKYSESQSIAGKAGIKNLHTAIDNSIHKLL